MNKTEARLISFVLINKAVGKRITHVVRESKNTSTLKVFDIVPAETYFLLVKYWTIFSKTKFSILCFGRVWSTISFLQVANLRTQLPDVITFQNFPSKYKKPKGSSEVHLQKTFLSITKRMEPSLFPLTSWKLTELSLPFVSLSSKQIESEKFYMDWTTKN